MSVMINLVRQKQEVQEHTPHLDTMLGKEHLANKVLINNVATVVVANQTLHMSVIGHRYNEQSDTQTLRKSIVLNTDDSS
jgi:hypothetical protein